MDSENIHKEHRKRLLERYEKYGLDSFSTVEKLELILTFAIPRKNVNPLAHALLERFRSIHNVFEAPSALLREVPGLTPRAAMLLHLIPQLWTEYDLDKRKPSNPHNSTEALAELLVPKFRGKREESAWLLCLDAKYKVLDCRQLCVGSINSVSLSVRRVVEFAMNANASIAVLAHNHVSGVALPSREDIETTRRLAAALRLVDVTLADHLIVADDDYVSLYQSGYLSMK